MKTSLLTKAAGALGLLFLLIPSGAFADAGQLYSDWTQVAKNQAEAAKKANATKPVSPPAMACTSCKTTDVTQYHPSMVGGKVPAFDVPVGTKHTCATCGGAITTIRGKTTSDMKGSCPICAKANPTCCTTGT